MRRAKIVATIGPVSRGIEVLERLIHAGMDAARLNFSHADHDWHRETLHNVRKVSRQLDKPVAIIQDLQGVKIRTGPLENATPVDLTPGETFTITTEEIAGTRDRVSTSYQALPGDVTPGDRILLSDGLIELRVLESSEAEVKCEVIAGGVLSENQGINLPGVKISAPALTDKDLRDLEFGMEQEVDYIALSFIRRSQDLVRLKEKIASSGGDTPVIAKLEKPMAIENLEAIMQACEGVMVARGDLGVEMAPEKVPVIQKHVIEQANRHGKLVITATQMLESMIRNPRPTRAEASDVANAVFDGTDALMLSGETAKGRYAVEAVGMMSRIVTEAEGLPGRFQAGPRSEDETLSFPETMCDAAYHASKRLKARAIVAFTQSGSTARLISKYRPPDPILGVTPHLHMTNRLALVWGVQPLLMREIHNVDELIQELERWLLQKNLVTAGDNLIILTGAPIVERGHTSLMKLHNVKG